MLSLCLRKIARILATYMDFCVLITLDAGKCGLYMIAMRILTAAD